MKGSMGTLTFKSPKDVNALVLPDLWARHVGSQAEVRESSPT